MSDPNQEMLPSRQNLTFRNLPTVLRYGVVVANMTLPFIGLIVCSGFFMQMSSETDGHPLLLAMCGYIVSIAVVSGRLRYKLIKRDAYVYGVVTGCLFLGVSVFMNGFSSANIAFVLFLGMGIRRLGNLFDTDSISNANLSFFRVDSILLVIIGLMFAVTQPYVQTASGELLGEGFVFLLVCYVLFRIWTLWTVQRIESGTRYASKFGIYVMLMLAVLLALWGPFVFWHVIMVVIAFVAGVTLLVLGLLPFRLTKSVANPFLKNASQANLHGKNLPPPSHHISHGSMQMAVGIVVAVLLVTIVFILMRTKRDTKPRDGEATDDTQGSVIVNRKWVQRRSGFVFANTDDPVRLAYQEMLRRFQKEDISMHPSETPRTFEERVAKDQKPDDGDLRTRYEATRYGDDK